MLPPNHTAKRCMWWLMTLHSICVALLLDAKAPNLSILSCMRRSTCARRRHRDDLLCRKKAHRPARCFLSRARTRFLISRWSLRPKSLNMVDPPDSTMFCTAAAQLSAWGRGRNAGLARPHLVEPSARVDRTLENGLVDHLRQRHDEIRAGSEPRALSREQCRGRRGTAQVPQDFGIEEDLRPEEALEANVAAPALTGGPLHARKFL